jgi:hypothetical protein
MVSEPPTTREPVTIPRRMIWSRTQGMAGDRPYKRACLNTYAANSLLDPGF